MPCWVGLDGKLGALHRFTLMDSLIILLLLMGLVLWFWIESLGARERAGQICRQACQRCQVQLLDDTVALKRLWLRRNAEGRLCWERLYNFEFSDTGATRRQGSLLMLGRKVEVIYMEPNEVLMP